MKNNPDIPCPTNLEDMGDVYGLNQTFSKEEYTSLRKVNLNGLLNSYADEADVFSEIIQNAFDTIQICHSKGKYSDSNPPVIRIFIGRRSNDTHYFAVNDNGLGMDSETMNKFTVPGFTRHKQRGKTVGYKGVGASFFFASSEKISLKTIDENNVVSAMTVKGSYLWIMNETEPEPTVEDKDEFPKSVIDNIKQEQGTTICYYFHNSSKPKSLNNIVNAEDSKEKELTNWISYLCSKTALGQVYDISNQKIQVIFYLDDGNKITTSEWKIKQYDRETKSLGYPFPWRVFSNYIEKEEIDKVAHKNPGQLIKFQNINQAIHTRWSKSEIEAMNLTDNEDELNLINAHLEFVDIFLCWSTEVMKTIDFRIGARKSIIRYGIKLIVDGVPQGRMMDIDITSDIGLNRQTHLVIAFKELKLDDGRKIASDENISEVIRKISVRIMGIMKEYRTYLRKKERPPIAEDLEKWKSEIANQANTSIVRILFEKLNLTPPIHIDPNSENDVIALFVSLLSNNILKGYKLLALSGYSRYDGLINISKTDDLKDINDPFSIRDLDILPSGSYKVIEFKQVFSELIDNFNEKNKYASEVNLAVCWSLPTIGQNLGQIIYCYGNKKDYRPLYGITHIWKHEYSTIPIISLHHFAAEYLAYLESKENIPGIGTATLAQLTQYDLEDSI